MEATTKQYEAIEGFLEIPFMKPSGEYEVIENPTIDVSNPITSGTYLTFGININYVRAGESKVWTFNQKFTYNEVFTLLASEDLSNWYTTGASNSQEYLAYLMMAMANIYDTLLLKVSWLEGKIKVK